jgi:hypothetical protein
MIRYIVFYFFYVVFTLIGPEWAYLRHIGSPVFTVMFRYMSCPCNVVASTIESAYGADRPTVGYQGDPVSLYKQSMQSG